MTRGEAASLAIALTLCVASVVAHLAGAPRIVDRTLAVMAAVVYAVAAVIALRKT